MLNSKQKGNITALECMLAFVKLGYNVLTPYGDCERYDFVVDIKGNFYKIQVKTSRTEDEEKSYIVFNTSSQTTKNGKQVHHSYDKEQIDYFMTTYNSQAYLVPVQETAAREKRRTRGRVLRAFRLLPNARVRRFAPRTCRYCERSKTVRLSDVGGIAYFAQPFDLACARRRRG